MPVGKYLVYRRLTQESSRAGVRPDFSHWPYTRRIDRATKPRKRVDEDPNAVANHTMPRTIRTHIAAKFSAFTIDGATESRICERL